MLACHTRQQGLTTVFMTVILLLGLAILTVYANRVAIFDLKMTANQLSTATAFQAAESGREHMASLLEWYNRACRTGNSTCDTDGDGDGVMDNRCFQDDGALVAGNYENNTTVSCTLTTGGSAVTRSLPLTGNVNGNTYRVQLRRLGATNNYALLRVESEGCDALNGNCVTVSQTFVFKSALVGKPSAPLTAKGTVSTGGSASIVNEDYSTSGLTVHSGSTFNDEDNADSLESLPGTPPEASVADNDTTLSGLSDDDYFTDFFGDTKANVQASATQINPGNANSELNGQAGKVLWISGDTTINSNITVGTLEQPVILIVDGALHINGNVTIYGLVYCTAIVWDNTGMGNVNIYGAAVAEGSFTGNGNPTITYTPTITNNIYQNLGEYVRVIGTWRDF